MTYLLAAGRDFQEWIYLYMCLYFSVHLNEIMTLFNIFVFWFLHMYISDLRLLLLAFSWKFLVLSVICHCSVRTVVNVNMLAWHGQCLCYKVCIVKIFDIWSVTQTLEKQICIWCIFTFIYIVYFLKNWLWIFRLFSLIWECIKNIFWIYFLWGGLIYIIYWCVFTKFVN